MKAKKDAVLDALVNVTMIAVVSAAAASAAITFLVCEKFLRAGCGREERTGVCAGDTRLLETMLAADDEF